MIPEKHALTPFPADGSPVVGANVHVDNNSGGNSAATDARGVAIISLSELDVAGIDVDGSKVLDRPYAYTLGTPTVGKGLVVKIRLKGRSGRDNPTLERTGPAR